MTIPPSRLPQVGTTIFSVMSALAQRHAAVNLSQGFPDFDPPAELLDALGAAARAGHNQYAPMTGLPALREAIAAKVERLYGAHYDPEAEVTVTAGATQAVFTAVACMVRPGDEVIVFEPVYDSYVPAIELNGGTPVYARLRFPHYRPDWDEVRSLLTPRTRMIILNTPHNPTGTVWSAADMQALADLVRDTGIVLVGDEVYEHMVFDDAGSGGHQSLAGWPDLAARSFVVSSFGKTYHVTGWKVAYCLAPRELMAEFRKAHQFIVFTVHAPSQHALAAFMRHEGWYEELRRFYQGRRDAFRAALAPLPLDLLPCAGTYFQCLRFPSEVAPDGDRALVQRLVEEAGVAAIPVSAFHHDGHDERVIRLCFAKRDATLEAAVERLQRWFAQRPPA